MAEDPQKHRAPQNRQLISQKHILSWNFTDSPLCSDHCMIIVSIQSKKSEPQITITKLNINKVTITSSHQMKHGRKSQLRTDHNLLKL